MGAGGRYRAGGTHGRPRDWNAQAADVAPVLLKLGFVDLPVGASDFRLLSQRVAQVFRAHLPEQNPFLRGLAGRLGFKVSYLPFTPDPRARGRSNYRVSTLFTFALNGICSFSKLPLRFCIGIGLTVAALSVLGGITELVLYAVGRTEVRGWPSLIAALCFLGGIQLFFLGVIGEYVGLVFDEVKRRPRYLFDQRYATAFRVIATRVQQVCNCHGGHGGHRRA